MDVDVSELRGKAYRCLDGCAMCCLCQPELSMDELAVFRKFGLVPGLTRDHIQGYRTDEPTAIKLQGGNGACHFLLDRRCTIHDKRPAFCRQFPVHVHALDRVQLNANLSCRGITEGGSSLADFGNDILKDIDIGMMTAILSETRDSVGEFESEAQDAGIHQPAERLRSVAEELLPLIGRRDGIGKLMAFADSPQVIGDMPAGDILALIRDSEPPEDLEEAAMEGNYGQFELEKAAWQPVYVDERFRWRTYRSEGGKVHVSELRPDGAQVPETAIPMEELGLLLPDDGALRVFEGYARLLNSRDQFLGYAYHVCAEDDFQNDMMTVYLGVLGTTMLDLWWRAGLVGRIRGTNTLNAELALEGVKAFDMDCLDMPTVGAFF
jgi:Fe-S-cluster containining protein